MLSSRNLHLYSKSNSVLKKRRGLPVILPKLAMPMHYNKLDEIKADPNDFKAEAEEQGFIVRVFRIGETMGY